MALYLINTDYIEVVNTDDDCVELFVERNTESSTESTDEKPKEKPTLEKNTWKSLRSTDIVVKDGATIVRVKALTGPEVESTDFDSPTFSIDLALKSVHKDELNLFNSLPWHNRRSLGAFVYQVSTLPLVQKKKQS
jgi:hypothetical protein